MGQGQRIELLEVIQYVLALVLVVAAVDWNQYLVPLLVASVAAMPYAMWRKLQDVEREGARSPHAHSVVSREEVVQQKKRVAGESTKAEVEKTAGRNADVVSPVVTA